jgi:hypothetical protein
LSDCFKACIASSDLGAFLRASVGEILFEIARARKSEIKGPMQGFKGAGIQCMGRILANFGDNSSLLPNDVRLLIKLFTDLARDAAERLSRAEQLFQDTILWVIMLNPKASAPIRVTFQIADNSRF